MEITKQVSSNIKNIEYYLGKIEQDVQEQIATDCGNEEVNQVAFSLRFNCLAAIDTACTMMRDYLIGMKKNLETAEKQDKLFLKPETSISS
jgi:hypothetical protein